MAQRSDAHNNKHTCTYLLTKCHSCQDSCARRQAHVPHEQGLCACSDTLPPPIGGKLCARVVSWHANLYSNDARRVTRHVMGNSGNCTHQVCAAHARAAAAPLMTPNRQQLSMWWWVPGIPGDACLVMRWYCSCGLLPVLKRPRAISCRLKSDFFFFARVQ